MNINERVIIATMEALKLVRNVRFFRTERGHQGEFYCKLKSTLARRGILKNDIMLEIEYQKS